MKYNVHFLLTPLLLLSLISTFNYPPLSSRETTEADKDERNGGETEDGGDWWLGSLLTNMEFLLPLVSAGLAVWGEVKRLPWCGVLTGWEPATTQKTVSSGRHAVTWLQDSLLGPELPDKCGAAWLYWALSPPHTPYTHTHTHIHPIPCPAWLARACRTMNLYLSAIRFLSRQVSI